MKIKSLVRFCMVIAIALFSYNLTDAQVVDAVKKAADKTKEVTVDAAKKTVEVTKDVAGKTKDVTVDAAEKTADAAGDAVEATPKVADKAVDAAGDAVKATAKGAKKVGNYRVNITENVAGSAYEGGKWFVTSTWDGTKWVSKKVWYPIKKAGTATKEAVAGEDSKQP